MRLGKRATLVLVWGASALLASGAFVGGAYLSRRLDAPPADGSVASYRARIADELRRLGPAKAYAAFKVDHADDNYGLKHTYAHLFGELLYERYGLSAIGTCDTDFNYGCYHGFMTEAIAQNGFDAIAGLDQACHKTTGEPSACEHGIGHGIVEYLDHKDLPRALEACGATDEKNPLAGCYTGAFMEYFDPVQFDDQGTPHTIAHPLTAGQPYDLCPTLTPAEQQGCYYSLPGWWVVVFSKDYAELGTRCAAAPAPYRGDCYAGIATVIATSENYDADLIRADCAQLGAGKSTCFSTAANELRIGVGLRLQGDALCREADPADQPGCMRS